MKKWICGLSIIGLLVGMTSFSPLHAAGSCVQTDLETIRVDQFSGLQRKILTLTCTGDGSITLGIARVVYLMAKNTAE